MLKLLEAF